MTSLENRSRTALIVIDVQNGVIGKAYERDRVIANIATLLDKARAEDVPVVWVQHSDDDELTQGSEAWQYVDALERLDSEPVVHKRYPDAFEASDLEERLAERGVGRLVVTGAQTEECIRGDAARCARARLRRDAGRRRAHHRGPARVGVPGLPGAVDRVHQHVLELGVSTRSAGHGRTDHGGGLLRRLTPMPESGHEGQSWSRTQKRLPSGSLSTSCSAFPEVERSRSRPRCQSSACRQIVAILTIDAA